MILSDWEIMDLCEERQMISPWKMDKLKLGSMSYGLSHFGYDIQLATKVKTLPLDEVLVADPETKAYDLENIQYATHSLAGFFLKSGEFAIAGTRQYFRMPPNVCGLVKDKSTLARLGLAVQNTVLEPGWCGYLTVEISNHGPMDIELFPYMPIAQVLFFRGEEPLKPYEGKYQDQQYGQTAKSG